MSIYLLYFLMYYFTNIYLNMNKIKKVILFIFFLSIIYLSI